MPHRRPGGWADTIIMTLSLFFYATPLFLVGIVLVLVFGVWLDWLPTFGMTTVDVQMSGFARVLDVAKHAVLPVATLAVFYTAVYVRLTRASMIEVCGLPVYPARLVPRARPEQRITWVHILRNALLPVVTLAGIQAGHLIGGSVLVETVFAWPGIGSLAFEALLARDYDLLLGIFLCTSVVVLVFNLLTDLLYLWLDPRVQAL